MRVWVKCTGPTDQGKVYRPYRRVKGGCINACIGLIPVVDIPLLLFWKMCARYKYCRNNGKGQQLVKGVVHGTAVGVGW